MVAEQRGAIGSTGKSPAYCMNQAGSVMEVEKIKLPGRTSADGAECLTDAICSPIRRTMDQDLNWKMP